MSSVCAKHRAKPATIYHKCVGCEIDTLAQRCRELEEGLDKLRGDLEQAYRATNSECMDWAMEYERRKEAQAERDTLRVEVSDLKARLLEAERGNEELVRLRAERLERDMYERIARYLVRVYIVDDQAWSPEESLEKAMTRLKEQHK